MKTREVHANNCARPSIIVRMVGALHITVSVLNHAIDGLTSLQPGTIDAMPMRIQEIFIEIVDRRHRSAAHEFAEQTFHSGLIHPLRGVQRPTLICTSHEGPADRPLSR